MPNLKPQSRCNRRYDQQRAGFTLVELLVVSTIIAILAGMVTVGLAGASESAKRRRSKTQIAKIHELMVEKWESYETRSVRLKVDAAGKPIAQSFAESTTTFKNRQARNAARLFALRELMRYEMPDRVSDLMTVNLPQTARPPLTIELPSISKYYLSRAARVQALGGWTTQHQGAECLYLILSRTEAGDGFALDAFPDREIGDTDGDGMPEILDAWGRPMQFVRWPAGYTEISSYQNPLSTDRDVRGPDAFDFTGLFRDSTYTIFPLVFSNGADGQANIVHDSEDFANGYMSTLPPNNPYASINVNGTAAQIGSVLDATSNGHIDNITNHALGLTN